MSARWLSSAVFGAWLLGLCAACEEPSEPELGYDGPPLPWAYAPFPELREPQDNPSTSEKIALGRLLFYDPVLSRDEKTACATCHSEIWGLSDGLPLSVGVDGEGPTGPGREGPNVTTRNAQTLWNVALRPELFWDGRSASLEEQALEPIGAERELDSSPEEAAARLDEIPEYRALFAAAFPEDEAPVSPTNIARALAAFQRTMISKRAPYDRYVDGDEGALSAEQLEGMSAFADAGCAGCHVPPLFEANLYAARVPSGDEGRMAVTGRAEDRGKLRVPTLRNLRDTGPYFHDGSVATLEQAVAREAQLSAERGEGRALSASEIERVSVFLRKALMDRTREPDRPEQVPSGLEVPKDGFRIPR